MKVADVRYTGPMRSSSHKGPSGKRYLFKNPMGGDPRPTPIHSLEDALKFAQQDVFEVDWSVQGEVARRVGPQATNAQDALRELSYRQKQRLTSALDLDVKGNSKEDELERALEPAVEEMIRQVENQ